MKKYLIIAVTSCFIFVGCEKADPGKPTSGEQQINVENNIPPAKTFKVESTAKKVFEDSGTEK